MDSLIKWLTSDKGIAIIAEGVVLILMGIIVVFCLMKAVDLMTGKDDSSNWK